MLNVEGYVKDVRIDGNHKCRRIPKNVISATTSSSDECSREDGGYDVM